MTINIRSGEPGWTPIPHRLARDTRLSDGAVGLAVRMLSHADGYRSDEEFLAGRTASGRDVVRRELAELRRFGYLVRTKVRGADGRLTTVSVLYDTPQELEQQPVKPSPTRGKPASRSDLGKFAAATTQPDAGNPRDGVTSTSATKPQATPSRGKAATRPEQAEQGIAAGRPDSRETRVHIEDQGGEQKKISQSAQVREAIRWLHGRYGLTDQESAVVIEEARRRAAEPIRSLVKYLTGMAEDEHGNPKRDLADIVEAVQLHGRQELDDDAHEEDPQVGKVPGAGKWSQATPSPPPYVPPVVEAKPVSDIRSADPLAGLTREQVMDWAHVSGGCKTLACDRCWHVRESGEHPLFPHAKVDSIPPEQESA